MSSSARYSESPVGAAGPPLDAGELERRLEELVGAVLSSRRSAAAPARELAAQSRPLQDFVLRWAAVAAKSSPELAFQFAGLAARAVGELGYAGAERWLLAAIDVYDREGLACPACTCGAAGQAAEAPRNGAPNGAPDGTPCGVRRLVQSGRSTFYCAVRQR